MVANSYVDVNINDRIQLFSRPEQEYQLHNFTFLFLSGHSKVDVEFGQLTSVKRTAQIVLCGVVDLFFEGGNFKVKRQVGILVNRLNNNNG